MTARSHRKTQANPSLGLETRTESAAPGPMDMGDLMSLQGFGGGGNAMALAAMNAPSAQPMYPGLPGHGPVGGPSVPGLGAPTVHKFVALKDPQAKVDLVWNALRLKKDNLEGGKPWMQVGSGHSNTDFSAKAKVHRDALLANVARSTPAATAKAVAAATVPQGMKELRMEINSKAVLDISWLYSVIQHEYVHVEQYRRDWKRELNTFTKARQHSADEFEAYLANAEQLGASGLDDPVTLYKTWKNLADHFGRLDSQFLDAPSLDKKSARKRALKAGQAVFELCIDRIAAYLFRETKGLHSYTQTPRMLGEWRRRLSELATNKTLNNKLGPVQGKYNNALRDLATLSS